MQSFSICLNVLHVILTIIYNLYLFGTGRSFIIVLYPTCTQPNPTQPSPAQHGNLTLQVLTFLTML